MTFCLFHAVCYNNCIKRTEGLFVFQNNPAKNGVDKYELGI